MDSGTPRLQGDDADAVRPELACPLPAKRLDGVEGVDDGGVGQAGLLLQPRDFFRQVSFDQRGVLPRDLVQDR